MATAQQATIHAAAEKFQVNVLQYMRSDARAGGDNMGVVTRNMEEVHAWAKEQKSRASSKEKEKNMQAAAHAFVKAAGAIVKFASGDPIDVMQGCLEISAAVAALVGGPVGIPLAAVFTVIGIVLNCFRKQQPSLISQVADVVHQELMRFHMKLQGEKFAGLKTQLNYFIQQLDACTAVNYPADMEQRLIFDLIHFTGEVAYNFINTDATAQSKEVDLNDIVSSFVVYCYAQTSLRSLLIAVLCKRQELQMDTSVVEQELATQLQEMKSKLGFLSGWECLSVIGTLGDGKMYKMAALRMNSSAFKVVHAFRAALGLSDMPSITQVQTALKDAEPHNKNSNHFFQFVNGTDFPVKIVSGKAGDHINSMKFTGDVQPRNWYNHSATSALSWNFSVGGVVVFYLDGKMADDKNPFEGHVSLMEFAMANPTVGQRKISIRSISPHYSKPPDGDRCWKEMDGVDNTPINLTLNGESHQLVANIRGPSKDGCYTWQFIAN